MPRARGSVPNGLDHWLCYRLGRFKEYTPDLIFDARVIYQKQLEKFEQWYFQENWDAAQDIYQELCRAKAFPTHSLRLYVVTNDVHISLALYDMDERVIRELVATYSQFGCSNDEDLIDVKPSFRTAIFVFENLDLILYEELSTLQLADLMAVFRKENLVDFAPLRDALYRTPRNR